MEIRIVEKLSGEIGRMSMVNTPGNEASVAEKGVIYHSIQLSCNYISPRSLAYCHVTSGLKGLTSTPFEGAFLNIQSLFHVMYGTMFQKFYSITGRYTGALSIQQGD